MSTCDDCGKEIVSKEDELAHFNTDRCASCETIMFSYMEEHEANELRKKLGYEVKTLIPNMPF